jgi:DNA-binding transcriptional regulator YhcF (GntR family)
VDAPLVILLQRDSPQAAYEQIAAQIRSAIADGRLAPRAVLPGVRGLASDLGVNFNTVARAYRVLEEQGFVRIRERSGVEVVTPARRAPAETRDALERELWGLLVRMRQAGMPPPSLRALTDEFLRRLDGTS